MATHSYMCMCTKIGDLSKLHRSNVKTGLAEMKGEKRFRSEMVRARSSDFLATGAERANELIRGAKSRPVLSAIDARAPWHNPLAFLVSNPQSAESHPPINEREMRERTSSRRAQKASERDLVRLASSRRAKRCHFSLALCVGDDNDDGTAFSPSQRQKRSEDISVRWCCILQRNGVEIGKYTPSRAHAGSENQLGRVEKVCAQRKRGKLAFSNSLRTSPNDVLVEWKEMLFLVSAARGDFFLACWHRLPKLGWEFHKMAFVLRRGSELSHCQIP